MATLAIGERRRGDLRRAESAEHLTADCKGWARRGEGRCDAVVGSGHGGIEHGLKAADRAGEVAVACFAVSW
jgi:hypothetical protein